MSSSGEYQKIAVDVTGGIKHDALKVRWELLPMDALNEVAEVLTFGAFKYGDRNWEKGFNWMRIIGSLMRHLSCWICGQSKDSETSLSHLSHAACNILFLLTFELRGVGTDDRPKREEKKS